MFRSHSPKIRARIPSRTLRRASSALLESLESRILLTSIPGLPGFPGLPANLTLPNFTNGLNLGSLNSFLSPDPNDYWWLKNTGQTLSNPTSGPATGHPGADVDALDAWNLTQGNSNVVIAVLDTGIDLNNPDLASVLWSNPGEIPGDGIDNDNNGHIDDTHGWNFLDNSSDVTDNFVHGTAVAGVIHSVAPNITILPVEIGTSSGVNSQDVIDGINYIIALKQAGVNIVAINASYISFSPPSQGETDAINAAGSNGMLYIAAAGNASMNLDSLIPNIPSWLQQYIPSFLPSNLIFVAATDNQDNLADFSDYGSRTVALGAPGVDITLAIPGGLYAPLSGTSFAAPMVSAIAGLLKSKVPSATMAQLKSALLNSGDLDPSLVGKTVTGRRANAFKALNYLIGNQPATGAVTSLNADVIEGWAYDPNLGTAPANVQIVIDSTTYTIPADQELPELTETLGADAGPNHGFSFETPTLAYGKHTVKVYVLDEAGKPKLLSQGSIIINESPTGNLESADLKTITGWATDSDTPAKPVTIKLYLDGKSWMSTTAKVARPDMADDFGPDAGPNHGFSIKPGTLKPGIHRIDTYAIDALTGALTLLGTTEVSSNREATGIVESLDVNTITGWAFDPDAGSKSIQVRYTIDDGAPVFVNASLIRNDLALALGSKNHGFSITLPKLTAGEHTITVDAVDPNNKLLVQLTSQTLNIADPDGAHLPTGTVEFAANQITGSATDEDSSTPINIRIDIDGKPGIPFATASDNSFTYTLPTLSPGPHRVDVFAFDDATPILISRQLVNCTPPSAQLESITELSAIGWALAPSAPKQQAFIRIDIETEGGGGVLTGNLVTATLPRPDLTATKGATNIGFNIPLPKLAPGNHTATVYLIDPTTLSATILGTLDYTTT